MDKLRVHTEDEELMEDSRKLQFYNNHVKPRFCGNLDELHIKFLHENLDIVEEHDAQIVRRVFQFLKNNA
jgi:hypothetical protein